MRTTALDIRARNARTELALLLLASLGCALALTAGFADTAGSSIGMLAVRHLVLVTLVAGAAGIALLLVWQATRSAQSAITRSGVRKHVVQLMTVVPPTARPCVIAML